MRNGKNDPCICAGLGCFADFDTELSTSILWTNPGVMHINVEAVVDQFTININDPSVAQIGAVFLKGESQ